MNWISVKDELSEAEVEVIVRINGFTDSAEPKSEVTYEFAKRYPNKLIPGYYDSRWPFSRIHNVTHWMRIEEPNDMEDEG